jgi:hypothetical protein
MAAQTFENVVFNCVPILSTAARIAIEMVPAMRAYSMAVVTGPTKRASGCSCARWQRPPRSGPAMSPKKSQFKVGLATNWRVRLTLLRQVFSQERCFVMPTSPRYARGCDLTKIAKSADTPPVDLNKVLNVDSSNPYLRAIRIQNGHLRLEDVPVELRARVPVTSRTPGERQ